LFEKNIVIIPDILANAGGVTVSYFEQVQNNINFYWDAKEVDDRLRVIMQSATRDVIALSTLHQIDLRTAGYVVSLQRILEAMKQRHIVAK